MRTSRGLSWPAEGAQNWHRAFRTTMGRWGPAVGGCSLSTLSGLLAAERPTELLPQLLHCWSTFTINAGVFLLCSSACWQLGECKCYVMWGGFTSLIIEAQDQTMIVSRIQNPQRLKWWHKKCSGRFFIRRYRKFPKLKHWQHGAFSMTSICCGNHHSPFLLTINSLNFLLCISILSTVVRASIHSYMSGL
jgi:hypothetical protein